MPDDGVRLDPAAETEDGSLPTLVKDGDTALHTHEDFEAVLKPILNEFYMTPTDQRPMTWAEFAHALDEDFQIGLREYENPGPYLRRWCDRYIATSWSMTEQMVRKRVAEADDDLVTAVKHREQARKLERDIEERIASDDHDPSLSEIASAREKASKLRDRADEALERWLPEFRSNDGEQAAVQAHADEINIEAHLDQASGRDRAREIDADADVKD